MAELERDPWDQYLWLVGPEWEQQEAAWARDDLISFIRRLSPGYRPAPFHFVIAEKLKQVADGEIARLMITMPPRHGKSTLASRYFPAWYLGRYPDRRIIATSYAARLAERFGRFARNVVNDQRYPFPIKLARDSKAADEWDIQGHAGGYLAAGVLGPVTGSGGDIILVDDPTKSAQEADSEAFRERTIEWYTETLYPRLESAGAIVMIGTRWRDDDLLGYALEQQDHGGDRWELLHLPAINDAGEPLWPERYGLDELAKRKANMGSRMWDAQYQGKPVPAEGGTFKTHWWSRYRELPRIVRVELLMDSAFKTGVQNDFTAVSLWGLDATGGAYLIWVWRRKVAFPDLIRMAYECYDWATAKFPGLAIPLVIEDKASGQSAIQTLRDPMSMGSTLLPLPVIAYPVPPNSTKESRAEGVTGFIEGGRAFIPEEAPWLKDWLTEHNQFPLGANDDQVDNTTMALMRFSIRRHVSIS